MYETIGHLIIIKEIYLAAAEIVINYERKTIQFYFFLNIIFISNDRFKTKSKQLIAQ